MAHTPYISLIYVLKETYIFAMYLLTGLKMYFIVRSFSKKGQKLQDTKNDDIFLW